MKISFVSSQVVEQLTRNPKFEVRIHPLINNSLIDVLKHSRAYNKLECLPVTSIYSQA